MEEWVSIKQLLKYRIDIEFETYCKLLDLQLEGATKVRIPAGTLDKLKEASKERKAREILLNSTVRLNNKGIDLEKSGKIKQAINVYEKNISMGYPAHHAYKRLMVLYRKAKDRDNEIRVINRALEVFGDFPEYVERLRKLNACSPK